MMKKSLIEQLKRIHRLNYGNKVLEEGFIEKIFGKDQKKNDDPGKADLVSSDVEEFYKTLENAATGGGISQQERGSMTFQKEVESMQIGLVLLGYELPKYGVDGLFGPETASAVRKFTDEKVGELKEDASDLRSALDSLGYLEKGGEISNGGNITDEISKIVSEVLKDYKQTNPNVQIIVTAGNDKFHKNLGYQSKHVEGKAIDLVLKPYNSENAKSFIDVLNKYKSKDSKFSYIDEYTNPSGAATGGHFHLQYGAGTAKGSGNIQATPEMLNKLIDLLKQKGIKSEDLKKLIDQSVSGITQKIDVSNFESITDTVIKTFEGGYYHPDMLKDGRVKDGRYGNSGETMFGIDRKAGGKMTNEGPAAQEFWKLIDDANARTNWQWNYMGGPLESRLRKLASDIIKPYFASNVNRFLNPEAREIVLNDKKLMVNFAYATWNGPGWFQKFANVINESVKSGTTDPEQLSDILLRTRLGSGNSLIAQGGKKMEKLINFMS